MKKHNRINKQKTDKDLWWCSACDCTLVGHTGLCTACGCKAKKIYGKKKKGMNLYKDQLEGI